MIGKKLEVKLEGKKYPVWFNLYSKFELLSIYGTDEEGVFTAIEKRQKESPLLLFGDLLKAGLKGASLAKNETTPDVAENIHKAIATMEEKEMLRLWGLMFDAFKEHMGMNIEPQKGKKKVKIK